MDSAGDHPAINDMLNDALLEEVFAKLDDTDKIASLTVCRRWKRVFDESHRLITGCYATFENRGVCLQWLRAHSHSVTYLNCEPDMMDEDALKMVKAVHKRLKSLVINLNRMLPASLPPLAALTHLDVQIGPKIKLQRVLAAAAALPALTHLRLDSRRMALEDVTLPDALLSRAQLRSLVVSKDPYSERGSRLELDSRLSQLTQLTELVMLNVGVPSLPGELAELAPTLHALAVAGSSGPLELPQELSALSSLRILQLEYCDLWQLPPQLLALTALEKLSLEGNALTELPEGLSALQRLNALVLGHNEGLQLCNAVSMLSSLTELDAHKCGMAELPVCVTALSGLLDLKFSYNELKSLPLGPYLCTLTRLDLGGNRLEELPSALAGAGVLQELLVDGQVEDLVVLTKASAQALVKWTPKLRTLAVVDRNRPLKKAASGLRHLWLDASFDQAVEFLREHNIEVQ